jgi:hypothetical protein
MNRKAGLLMNKVVLVSSLTIVSVPLTLLSWALPAYGQPSFENAPINYHTAPARDPVAQLQQQIDQGTVRLDFDEEHGYLKSVLQKLNVSPASQMLVFSKTSFQRQYISPRTPRAVYFNDNVYVGWVQGGDVMEMSAVDPELGAVFYTLRQRAAEKPRFIRDRGDCLSCHASSRTHNVPGHLVRSVFSSPSGLPHFGAGTFRTTHASPLKERWGGWYVTGTHGAQRHMGNVVARNDDQPEKLDLETGANLVDLQQRIDASPYLNGHSDIVALMVLEHQADMHNLITRAHFDARFALRDAKIMNKLLDEPDDYISPSTERRLRSAAEKVVRYMLFVDETVLTDPIKGTSQFTDYFVSLGPKDSKGRSLRDLDLRTRLFRFPCSYLIHSEAFAALPFPLKQRIYDRLWQVVLGEDASEEFAHLSADDRQAIREILTETVPELSERS